MKATISTEWLSGCGGCHVAIVDLHDKVLKVFEEVDLKHCPVLTDIKDYPKVTVGIVEGGIRTEHDRSMLKAMRDSCDILIAFGTCAVFGGPSGIGWLHEKDEIFSKVYGGNPTTKSKDVPTRVPKMEHSVFPIDEMVKVDLYIPGCPHHPHFIFEALTALLQGKSPKVTHRTVCSSCNRKIVKRTQGKLKRMTEGIPEDNICFLSQGYVCLGSVTLDRCFSPCPKNGMICTGCCGPSINIILEPNRDLRTELAQRIHMLTTIAEEAVTDEIQEFSKTHYCYALASSMLYKKPAFHLREWIERRKEK